MDLISQVLALTVLVAWVPVTQWLIEQEYRLER